MRRPYSCFRAARKRTKPPGDCPAHCVPRGDALRGGNRAGATYLYIVRIIDNNAVARGNVMMAGQFRNGSQTRGRPAVIRQAPRLSASAMYLYIVRTIDNNTATVLKLPRGREASQAAGRLPDMPRIARGRSPFPQSRRRDVFVYCPDNRQ